MPTGDAYSSEHLVPSHFGLAYVLLVKNNPYPELVVIYRTTSFDHLSVHFRCFSINDIIRQANSLHSKQCYIHSSF